MGTLRRRLLVALLCAAVLGCASKSAKPTAEPRKPTIKTIAILPVQEPHRYTLEKAPGGLMLLGVLGVVLESAITSDKSDQFGKRMKSHQNLLGKDLFDSLITSLREQGYEIVDLRDQDMGYVEPGDYDYNKVKTDADAILHVWIDRMGAASPASRITYRPQLNVNVRLLSQIDHEIWYDEGFDYGSDAHKADWGNLPADAKYSWGTFEKLLAGIPELVDGLQVGARALGAHIPKQLRKDGY